MSAAAQGRVWVLNLDAEHELEARHRYAPTRHLRALVAREQQRLLGSLVAPGDMVLGDMALDDSSEGLQQRECDGRNLEGMEGMAWCPTPRALARLRAVGARPPAAPDLATLRAANTRSFAAAVRAPLARASFEKRVLTGMQETLEALARPADDGWLVRRSFGAAGRGRRRLSAGAPTTAERDWLRTSLTRGALVIEPWVRVTREYTRSAWVTGGGEVVISEPCFQATTGAGAWLRTERAGAGALSREDDARLEEAVSAAGAALAGIGYFGPFGIDAYRHRTSRGEVLNPLSEINARFTMDWATAMARTGDAKGIDSSLADLLARQDLACR